MDESAEAIAEFMANGGNVLKAPETIRVTAREVVDYLRSRGIAVGFSRSSARAAYTCDGKRVSLRKLVDVANRYRSADHLPPFAART